MKESGTAKTRGRPREFDEAKALERAMHVFWRRGYEGASLPELTEAMGINRPSLYAAFGNKEGLFRRALDRYAEGGKEVLREAQDRRTGREFVERLLVGSLERVTKGPGGCLMVQAALACGAESEAIKDELALRRASIEAVVRKRLQSSVEEAELDKRTDVAALAKYFVTVLHGMAVQAAGGVKEKELREVIRVAMRSWPGK